MVDHPDRRPCDGPGDDFHVEKRPVHALGNERDPDPGPDRSVPASSTPSQSIVHGRDLGPKSTELLELSKCLQDALRCDRLMNQPHIKR